MKTTDNEIVLCCMYTCEEEKLLYFCYDIQGVLVLSLWEKVYYIIRRVCHFYIKHYMT